MPRRDYPPPARDGAPDWAIDAVAWPDRVSSEFWRAGAFTWHVQRRGSGPVMLLLHGTGASAHSWRPLVDVLESRFELISIDLPGHGFTRTPSEFQPSLPNVCKAVKALLSEMDLAPQILVGHSAGAAIAITLAARHAVTPQWLVSINGALKPFDGLMRMIAPATAKAATFGGLAARMVARHSPGAERVRNLVKNVGSDPDRVPIDPYATLLRRRGHIQGALRMMAHWDIRDLMQDCASLDLPMSFLAGAQDKAVPPSVSKHAAGQARRATYFELDGLGHLAHEEDPDETARILLSEWDRLNMQQDQAHGAG